MNSVYRFQRPADRRLAGLDLVRAIAIGWVMLYHASLLWHVPGDGWIVRFGWMGVDLFFVLSGFLIAGQLLRPWARGATPDFRQFMARRLLRTLPAYYVVLALYFLVPALRDGLVLQPLWQFLTFTQNLVVDPAPRKVFSHAWSLCVEEQFYLVLPLVVALMAIRPRTWQVATAVAAVLLSGIVLRGYLWLHAVTVSIDGVREPQGMRFMGLIYYPTWSRLDGLLAGVMAALVQTFRADWWRALRPRANLLLLAGVAGLAAAIGFFGQQVAGLLPTMFGYPLIAGSAALIVVAASESDSLAGRYAIPGVRALATGAYSLYLTHKMVFHLVQATAPSWPQPLQAYQLGLALPAALLAATLLYWSVERPFLKLRERLRAPTALADPRHS